MTRPNQSALVLDGDTIKARLQASRSQSSGLVHVDWLRFTCTLRNAPIDLDKLFPVKGNYLDVRQTRLDQALIALKNEAIFAPAAQAATLAEQICAVLGEDFTVDPEVKKGHDFYARRWSILREGKEVGWVGYGSSSDSPRQTAQARTIHANLYGHACTFARIGWASAMADLIDETKANITRADLALDFFDGLPGGMESVVADYKAGACDVMGKTPKCNMVGDWINGQARSFYLGSKGAGKQSNVYEKGHQLYGEASGSPWTRVELRYGNKLRDLPSDILRRADDFFAGASDWHAAKLVQAGSQAIAQPVTTRPRLAAETVEAEVSRVIRWFRTTAAASAAFLFQHSGDEFLDFVTNQKLPGRLQSFRASETKAAVQKLMSRFSTVGDYSPVPV